MNTHLAMGLRADEAREILQNNGYTEEKYAYPNRACNDGSGYLYAMTMALGAFASTAAAKAIQCSIVWMNDPSCELENPIIPIAIGGFLGLCIPICLLRKADRSEISEAERINNLRKHVMKIIDDNYQDCTFHRPLKGVHVSELLKLTDENTQEQLLDRLNQVQITPIQTTQVLAQVLKNKSIYSSKVLENIQNKAKPKELLTEVEWEAKVESEIKSWENLKKLLINNDEEEIGKAYAACKDAFGAATVDNFVKKYITNDNLKSIHKLSEELKQSCNNYYQTNKIEIDSKNYFK